MKGSKFFILIIAIIFSFNGSFAQERPTHELHSMMIYNFLKYIQWPAGKNSGEFVIGVVGEEEVFNTLNTWYGNKTRGDKKFIIKKLESNDDLSQCQLLYVGKGASSKFKEVLAKVSDRPVLTVTNQNGLAQQGSCINFKVVNNRLKFELNPAAITRSNLKSSSQLAAMAIVI